MSDRTRESDYDAAHDLKVALAAAVKASGLGDTEIMLALGAVLTERAQRRGMTQDDYLSFLRNGWDFIASKNGN